MSQVPNISTPAQSLPPGGTTTPDLPGMALPTDREALTLIEQLVREADQRRRQNADNWDFNNDLFEGRHWKNPPTKGRSQVTWNKIQDIVLSQVSILTEKQPVWKLHPADTNDTENPILFLNPLTAPAKLAMVPPGVSGGHGLEDEQVAGHEEVDPAKLAPLMQMGILTPDDVVQVTDVMATDACQQIMDIQRRLCGTDHHIIEMVLDCQLIGHQGVVITWDEIQGRCRWENLNPRLWWLAPEATWVEDSEYAIVDRLISVDQAKRQFPEMADKLAAATLNHTSGLIAQTRNQTQTASFIIDMAWERPMLVLRSLYYRTSKPMSVDEAEDAGFITCTPSDPVDAIIAGHVDPQYSPPAEGVEGAQPQLTGYTHPDSGEAIDPTHPSWPAVCQRVDGGGPIDETSPDWPQKPSFRLVITLVNSILYDGPLEDCPGMIDDIPLAMVKNIPRRNQWCGIGEPRRLWDPQRAINTTLTALEEHVRYHGAPTELRHAGLVKAMKGMGTAHRTPGMVIEVPQDVWSSTQGVPTKVEPVPPMSPGMFQYLEFLDQKMDKYGHVPDATQGVAPAGRSGEAIQSLQASSKGLISFKAAFLARCLKRVGVLMIKTALRNMTEKQWEQHLSGFNPAVFFALRSRIKDIDWDIEVEIAAGGSTREQDEQKATAKYQMGLAGKVDTLEALGDKDPDGTVRRQEMEQVQAAQMQAAAQAQMQLPPTSAAGAVPATSPPPPPEGGQPQA